MKRLTKTSFRLSFVGLLAIAVSLTCVYLATEQLQQFHSVSMTAMAASSEKNGPQAKPQETTNTYYPSEPLTARLIQSLSPRQKEDTALAPSNGMPTHWYSTVGTAFIPSSSTITWQYGNSGCLQANAAGYWRAGVHLPDGTIIKYLRISYNNAAAATSSSAWVTRYRDNGTYLDLASVTSRSGATTGIGYFSDLSGEIIEANATIDNVHNGYVFIWSGSLTQKLCSVQVGYIPVPVYAVALPVVQKQ